MARGDYFDDPDEPVDPALKAFQARFGDCRIPTSTDLRNLSRGRGFRPTSQERDAHDRAQRSVAESTNPRTGGWWPYWREWKPKPPGYSPGDALRRSLFKVTADPYSRARRAGRKGGASRSERKVEAARRNGRLSRGGYVRSPEKAEASRRNGVLGGRSRRVTSDGA